jgi:hypothetical protein
LGLAAWARCIALTTPALIEPSPSKCCPRICLPSLSLEEKVAPAVKKLKERGLASPYLRSFVVARINPLRWIKDEPPPLEEVLKTM